MVPPRTADGRGIRSRGRVRGASAGRRQANGDSSGMSRNPKRTARITGGTAENTAARNSKRYSFSKESKTDGPNGRASKRANNVAKTKPLAQDPSLRTESPQTLQSFQQRYQSLKLARERERAQAISSGILADPNKPRTLAEAITPKGTCQDMCPEFERVERVVQNDVWAAEASSKPAATSRQLPIEANMVKKFRRAAAGLDEQLPSDLRPPQILQMTVDYLFDTVIGEADSLASVHHFVWDRTRAIRNDFSIQQIAKASELRIAIDCYERIARFHIVSLHQLALPEKPYDKYDAQQEREQLDKTLLSLIQYYDDSRSIVKSDNEAEFRAYCIVFQIQDPVADLEDRVQTWPSEILYNARVQRALSLYAAASNTSDGQGPLKPRIPHLIAQANWRKFWALVFSNEVSYLMACVAEIYFGLIRRTAINSIWRSYRRGGNSKTIDWTLDELIPVLGFENEDEVQEFCEQYGFTVSEQPDGTAYVELESIIGRQLPEPTSPVHKQLRSALVEYKRHDRTLPAVIRGITFREAAEAGMLEGTSDDEMTDDSAQPDSLFIPRNKDVPAEISASQLATQGTPTFSPLSASAMDQKAQDGALIPRNRLGIPVEPVTPVESGQGSLDAVQSGKTTPANPSPFASITGGESQPRPGLNDPSNTSTSKSTAFDDALRHTQSSPFQLSPKSNPSQSIFSTKPSLNTPISATSSITQPLLSESYGPVNSRTIVWPSGHESSSQRPLPSFRPAQAEASIPAAPATQTPSVDGPNGSASSKALFNFNPTSSRDQSIPQPSPDQASAPAEETSKVVAQPVSNPAKFSFSGSIFPSASSTMPSSASHSATLHTIASPTPTKEAVNEVQANTPIPAEKHKRIPEPINQSPTPQAQLKLLEEERARQAAEAKARQAAEANARQAAEDARSLQERKSKLIDDLANIMLFERHGLLNQYIEYLAGPLIRAAQHQVEREELHRGADAYRVKTLSQRYGGRWRQIVWERQVKRRGKERRERQTRNARSLSLHSKAASPEIRSPPTSNRVGIGHHPAYPPSTAIPTNPDISIGNSPTSSSRSPNLAVSNVGTSGDSVSTHDAEAAERRRQRLKRRSWEAAAHTLESVSSRPYNSLDEPRSTSPPTTFGTSPYPNQRTDTTRSSYFKLKALGVSQHGSINLHPKHSIVSDLKRQRSLEPEIDAVPHSKRKARGFTHSLDLGKRPLLVPRRPHHEALRRPSIERNEANESPATITRQDNTLRMLTDSAEVSDEDERLLAAARSTRQAMTESISFFKEEAAKGRLAARQSRPRGHLRGAASLDNPLINAHLPRTYSTSAASIPTTQQPPPRYRARVSKFLRRDEYADLAASQPSTLSSQHRSSDHNLSSSQSPRRGISGRDTRANTRPFTNSLFGPKRDIGAPPISGITSAVGIEDDEGYGEDVDSDEKETRKKLRTSDLLEVKPRPGADIPGDTTKELNRRAGSENVTSLEDNEDDVEAATEDEDDASSGEGDEDEEEGGNDTGYGDAAWASQGGTSFDDAIEL